MSTVKPKRKNKYHELDNIEDVESIRLSPSPAPKGQPLARNHSAESFPSVSTNPDSINRNMGFCSSSGLKPKGKRGSKEIRCIGFSPKSYKKGLQNESLGLENAVMDLINLIELGEKGEQFGNAEKKLLGKLSEGVGERCNTEEMFLRIK